MDVMAPMTSERDGDLMTRRPTAAGTGEHTLKIEAARAGVGVGEYHARLRHGLLWCYRCQDWHQAEAFPADARRHSGRAGSCHQAIRAAARDALARRGQVPPPAAVWVIRRPGPAPRLPTGGQRWAYWRGPGRGAMPGPDRAGAWSPAPGKRRRPVPRPRPGTRRAHHRVRRGRRGPARLPPGQAGVTAATSFGPPSRQRRCTSPARGPARGTRPARQPGGPSVPYPRTRPAPLTARPQEPESPDPPARGRSPPPHAEVRRARQLDKAETLGTNTPC